MKKYTKRTGKTILETRATGIVKSLDLALTSLRSYRKDLTDAEFDRFIEFVRQQHDYYMKRMESFKKASPGGDLINFKF